MLKKTWKMFVVFAVVLLQFVFADLSACPHHNDVETQVLENVQTSDLFFGQNEIMVRKDGVFYEVKHLEKQESEWSAIVTFKGYCLRGHTLCDNCGLCHLKTCPFYVPYCNKWNK